MKLILIILGCMALFMLDGMLLRFTHLSTIEAFTILGCAIAAMIVWVNAMNAYINRNK